LSSRVFFFGAGLAHFAVGLAPFFVRDALSDFIIGLSKFFWAWAAIGGRNGGWDFTFNCAHTARGPGQSFKPASAVFCYAGFGFTIAHVCCLGGGRENNVLLSSRGCFIFFFGAGVGLTYALLRLGLRHFYLRRAVGIFRWALKVFWLGRWEVGVVVMVLC
jgi:hypothetical protein